jgi:transposase
MIRKHKRYDQEFKREAVRLLAGSEKSAREIEDDLGITRGLLNKWRLKIEEEGAEAFPGRGHQNSEEQALRDLRKENELLRQEREILKKALAIFSSEAR